MLRFYDRKTELEHLQKENQLADKMARFTVVLGQRRVGKTRLVTEFAKRVEDEKNTVLYFYITRKTPYDTLLDIINELEAKLNSRIPKFVSLEDAFLYIFELARTRKLTVLIDEFQNFTYVDKSVFSILQKLWDSHRKSSKLHLVVIGSSYSMMEDIFTNAHEPLFGRANSILTVRQFPAQVTKRILKDHGAYRQMHWLNLYALFGGAAKYYTILEEEDLMRTRVNTLFRKLFLEENSLLKDEGRLLLIEEMGRESRTYMAILKQLDQRTLKGSQIAKELNMPQYLLMPYLQKLQDYWHLIETEHRLIKPEGAKRFRIASPFIRFYLRFIYRNEALFEQRRYDKIFELFTQQFRTFRGYAFEEFVKQAMIENPPRKFKDTIVGVYADKQHEADLILEGEDRVYVGECKVYPKTIKDLRLDKFLQTVTMISEQTDKRVIPVYFVMKTTDVVKRRLKDQGVQLHVL